jgi:hypothetical protein
MLSMQNKSQAAAVHVGCLMHAVAHAASHLPAVMGCAVGSAPAVSCCAQRFAGQSSLALLL